MSKQGNVFKKTVAQVKAVKLLANSAYKYIMLYGGSRSGKTAILIYAVIIRALKAPKSRHLILRRYFNTAMEAIWLDTLPTIAGLMGVTYTEHEKKYIKFPNGSEIWIGGLDDKKRADKILGKEYSTIYFNECNEMSWDSINTAMSRLAQKTELRNRMYFDMNPPSKSHWTYKVFVQKINPDSDGEALKKGNLYGMMQINPQDNKDNIDEEYIDDTLGAMSERKRKRFLLGEFVTDVEGALWDYELIEQAKTDTLPEHFDKVCVAVDPAVTSNPESDDTGIIINGKAGEIGYVLEDVTGKYTPLEWATKAVDAYYKWEADFIVVEVNQGGDMVKAMIRQVDDTIRVKTVRATRGKALRAEPIVGLYEQGRIKHYGSTLKKLEEEMTDWDATDPNAPSPNRIDANVYGLSKLMLKKSSKFATDNFIDI